MDDATRKFLTEQDQINRTMREIARKKRARQRIAAKTIRLEMREARRRLRTKVPQLIKLISERSLWEAKYGFAGYFFALGSYRIDRCGQRKPLVLRIRKAFFGRTQYVIGFIEGAVGMNPYVNPISMDDPSWIYRVEADIDRKISELQLS